jgi:chromosome segregation ATPase
MNIDLTDREIELMMGALGTNIETIKRRHDPTDAMIADLINELSELETDLREALHRQDDGWGIDAEINAETQMFNAGVDAREQVKATSRAADRRALKFVPPGQGTKGDRPAPKPKERSEAQKHDVFEDGWNPDDPRNW